jgi:hypothetical protein
LTLEALVRSTEELVAVDIDVPPDVSAKLERQARGVD